MRSPVKRPLPESHERRTVFILIVLIFSSAALLPSFITAISGHPDLYFAKPQPLEPGVAVLDWQTLDRLLLASRDPAAARRDLFGPEVEITGYAISITNSGADKESSHFLLAPDPGDWLHPPHLHPGEVIEIRVKENAAVRFVENAVLTVRGTLSAPGMELNQQVLWHLIATAVTPFPRPRVWLVPHGNY
jgi:hypothetical protein